MEQAPVARKIGILAFTMNGDPCELSYEKLNKLAHPADDGKTDLNPLQEDCPERKKQQTHFILASKDKKAVIW